MEYLPSSLYYCDPTASVEGVDRDTTTGVSTKAVGERFWEKGQLRDIFAEKGRCCMMS